MYVAMIHCVVENGADNPGVLWLMYVYLHDCAGLRLQIFHEQHFKTYILQTEWQACTQLCYLMIVTEPVSSGQQWIIIL